MTFKAEAGNTNQRGRLSTLDLLIKLGCFISKVNNVFNLKSSCTKLVSTRRSTVLILPLQRGFPGGGNEVDGGANAFRLQVAIPNQGQE